MVKSPIKPSGFSLRFKKLSPHARDPIRSSPEAAGLDLSSARNMTIKAKDKAVVPTDLQILLPAGCYGRIAPRSGLAAKHFIDVGAGVVDADYRGSVGVILFNFGDKDFEIKEGDRIAQLICEKIIYAQPQEVKILPLSERGENGFGSTGIN